MSEMIERMVRAMYEAPVPWRTGTADSDVNAFAGIPYEEMDGKLREHLLIMARAALAAAREPTSEMYESAVANGDYIIGWAVDPAHAWRAMIDEALK